jgi:hypothetical protein
MGDDGVMGGTSAAGQRGASIGQALALARRRAGLTVVQVSQRTRIREAIIRAIERDDFSACGGDFYARGDIRDIARVVGIDPEPLVSEYDAARWQATVGPGEVTAPLHVPDVLGHPGPGAGRPARPGPGLSVPGPAGPPARPGGAAGERGPAGGSHDIAGSPSPAGRGGRARPVAASVLAAALAVAAGVLAYHFVSGSQPATRAGGRQAALGHRHAAHGAGTGSGTARQAAAAGGAVVVRVRARRTTSIAFLTPAGTFLSRSRLAAGTSVTYTFRHPIDLRLPAPGSLQVRLNGRDPVPRRLDSAVVVLALVPGRPASVSAVPGTRTGRPLAPASATSFGINGPGTGDDTQAAGLAIDGNPATAWRSDWYTTPEFGNLYSGTGLLVNMGRPVTVSGVRVLLGGAPGARLQLRIGSSPSLAGLPVVARRTSHGRTVRFRLASPARGRYVLIWFTRLPPDQTGTFQVSIYDIRVTGR